MQAGVQTDEGKSSAEDCYFQVCQVDNQDQPPEQTRTDAFLSELFLSRPTTGKFPPTPLC